jgi:hypothetical protein
VHAPGADESSTATRCTVPSSADADEILYVTDADTQNPKTHRDLPANMHAHTHLRTCKQGHIREKPRTNT